MKKILFLLILIIGLSPLLVGACTLAATPSGFDIRIAEMKNLTIQSTMLK